MSQDVTDLNVVCRAVISAERLRAPFKYAELKLFKNTLSGEMRFYCRVKTGLLTSEVEKSRSIPSILQILSN